MRTVAGAGGCADTVLAGYLAPAVLADLGCWLGVALLGGGAALAGGGEFGVGGDAWGWLEAGAMLVLPVRAGLTPALCVLGLARAQRRRWLEQRLMSY